MRHYSEYPLPETRVFIMWDVLGAWWIIGISDINDEKKEKNRQIG